MRLLKAYLEETENEHERDMAIDEIRRSTRTGAYAVMNYWELARVREWLELDRRVSERRIETIEERIEALRRTQEHHLHIATKVNVADHVQPFMEMAWHGMPPHLARPREPAPRRTESLTSSLPDSAEDPTMVESDEGREGSPHGSAENPIVLED